MPHPARATYTEDVQQDGSVLPLLVGEQVCGELVDRWKTRGHAESELPTGDGSQGQDAEQDLREGVRAETQHRSLSS